MSDVIDNSVLVTGRNAITTDMKLLHSCFTIEAPLQNRMVIIKAQWNLSEPKEPTCVELIYSEEFETFKSFGREHTHAFRDKVAGDEFGNEVNIGLVRCRGHSQLYSSGGVADQINAYYSRYAPRILSFLEGKEDFDELDTSYNNSWGTW